MVRPARLTVWRVLHALFALLCLVWAAVFVVAGAALGAALCLAGAAVFGASALRAPHRLDRQVARLALARDRNAPGPAAGTTDAA